jgi:hypothetical protein
MLARANAVGNQRSCGERQAQQGDHQRDPDRAADRNGSEVTGGIMACHGGIDKRRADLGQLRHHDRPG